MARLEGPVSDLDDGRGMSSPRETLRDRMLAAPEGIDARYLPPRFNEARELLRETLAAMEGRGIPGDTVMTVMLSETVPRMTFERGPAWTAATLNKLAQNIALGTIPNSPRQ